MRRYFSMGAIVAVLMGSAAAWAEEPAERPMPQPGESMPNEFWLGIAVSPARGAIRSQLNLPDEQGLIVDNVMPESPAAKAGIHRYDVLLMANDKPLKEVRDLLDELARVKDQKMAIKLVRGAKQETVNATPTKRPANMTMRAEPDQPGQGEAEESGDVLFFNDFLPRIAEGGPFQFHIFHPGQILPPGATLPKGMSRDLTITIKTEATLEDGSRVSIVRENQKPAQVTVTHEKEKWEATEGDLSKLPEKVRPDVEKLMHAGPMGIRMLLSPPSGAVRGEAGGARMQVRPFDGGAMDPRMERRMDEMRRNMEQMRKSIDEMRGRMGQPPIERPSPRKPAPEQKPSKIEGQPSKSSV